MNFFVERLELPTGKSRDVLYPTHGVETIGAATTSGGRGHWSFDGREFAVIGSNVVEIATDGTVTVRGAVAVDQYPATACTNGDGGGQVLFSSGNNGYCLTLATNVFAQVRTGGTRMVAHLDGFGLALDADTSTLFISDSLDFTTWDPTQFAQRSIQPDPWIAMKVWDRYIWLFGTETSEVWYNAGVAPFPFQAHPSGLVPFGTAAPFSVEIVSSGIMWLAATANGRGAVVRASGFTPEVVSTFPLHVAFAGYSDLDRAIGDTYEDLGHTVYLLTFPSSGTWAYDATSTLQLPHAMRWTERGTWISEDMAYIPWRAMFHAFAFGTHRMLDRETSAIYRMTADVLVDVDGRPLRRLRRPPAIWAREAALFISEFTVELEAGLGAVTGQGADPLVALRISMDGGKTFGSERTRSAGALGVYDARTSWTRCGSVKKGGGWQPEIVCTDPIPWRITGASFRGHGVARAAA